jgi:hypothetical protein
MDCEKFESTMIDELYEELDELTSAAAKRHVAGCARCAALLSGLKATRRLVRTVPFPLVEPSADFEDRILAAARDAQKVVPMKRRVSHAISWAGSWAMRPQTAMAALFLLMIGSSALLLRGKASKAPASATVTVSEQGAPVASAVTGTVARPADLESAQNAHGPPEAKRAAAPPAPPTEGLALLPPSLAPAATAGPGGSGFIANDTTPSKGGGGADLRSRATASSDKESDDLFAQKGDLEGASAYGRAANAAPPAAAPKKSAAASPAPASAPIGGAASGLAEADPLADQAQTEASKKASDEAAKRARALSDFYAAKGAFNAGNFTEATRLFDALAGSGDNNAALWAARSVREQSGCQAAIDRFDRLSARAFGTPPGYDATLDAGHCYRTMGSFDTARTRLVRLLTVQSHAVRAQAELDAMAPKAAAKPAARAPEPKPKAADVDQAY